MRLRVSSFLILLLCGIKTYAAGFPYELSPQREAFILGGAAVFTGASYYTNRNIEPLSREDVERLDRNSINRLDRSATNNWSPKSRKASDLLLSASLATPSAAVLPFAWDGKFKKAFTVTAMFGESILLTYEMTGTVKGSFRRTRPYMYNRSLSYEEKRKEGSDSRKSFFSGHSSEAFCAASFTATVFSDLHPDSPVKYAVGTAAFSLAAATGYLRYRAGMHYPTDIIAGAAAGALTGYLIPALHRKDSEVTIIPLIGNERGIAVILRY